jgi:hypothetical protein
MRVTLLYRVSLPECAHSASASFFFFFFFLPSLSFFAFFTLGSYKSQCAKTEQDVRREYTAKNKLNTLHLASVRLLALLLFLLFLLGSAILFGCGLGFLGFLGTSCRGYSTSCEIEI